MKNYAEELAYWYFRFNGFFVLPNYVTHPVERTNGQGYSDTDIIAIKPVGVRELVGLQTDNDYCEHLFHAIIERNINKTVAIICEVKAGSPPLRVVNDRNIRAQVTRIGIRPRTRLNLNKLRGQNDEKGLIYFDDNLVVYRLICKRDDNHYMENDYSWGILNINRIVNFMINKRFANYNVKTRGWDHYDSSLIQFLLRHQDLFIRPNE